MAQRNMAKPARAAAVAGLLLLPGSAPGLAETLAAPPGASACSGCHGPASLSSSIPSLQGQSAAAVTAAMAAFRNGERPATVMDRIAKGFTDEESRAIAAWLAGKS
jgi:cytochrome subunit of sulfide dehydrogenase